MKNVKCYKYVLILGVVFITGVFLTSTLAQSFSTPLYRPIVVVFGDSSEVETAVHTLVADYPSALVINYQDIHSLVSVLTLMRSHSPLILVGHGSEYGVLGPDNVMISWQDIGTWVNTLSTTFVFFLACNSNNATKFVQTHSYGFSGTIDGVLGAISIAANLQYANGNTGAIQQLLSQYISRAILLQSDKTKLMPLICYNGPVQSSPSSSNSVSPSTICPPPPPPPPTYYIIFTESGLPNDISWSVTLNGATKSARVDAAADPSSISFGVQAGTYSYSVSVPSEYYKVSPSSGSVSVSGWDVTIPITYTLTYIDDYGSCPNGLPGYHYVYNCIGPNTMDVIQTDFWIGVLSTLAPLFLGAGLAIVGDLGEGYITSLITGIIVSAFLWDVFANIVTDFSLIINYIQSGNIGSFLGTVIVLMGAILDFLSHVLADLIPLLTYGDPIWTPVLEGAEASDLALDASEVESGIIIPLLAAGLFLIGTAVIMFFDNLNNPNST